MSTPKYPGDLLLNFCDRPDIPLTIKLKFTAWGMAYNKGASAGVVIETKNNLSNGRTIHDEHFPDEQSCTISFKKLESGMTYADLMELSKWAKDAAKWVKHQEKKGKYQTSFDEAKKEVCSIIKEKW